ncbi:MAG: GntR family transcriptional regulator, partial [Verrucomicrobiaceae bacterium]
MSQHPLPIKPASPKLAIYEQIASVIQRQIDAGLFQAGQRIYSANEICQTFGVGDVTAKRAVRLLKQRGVVRGVVGSGAYVLHAAGSAQTEAPPRSQGVGMLKLADTLKPIFHHEMDLLQRELQRLGHPMIYAVAPDVGSLKETLDHLTHAGVGCLVVFPPHAGWAEGPQYIEQLRVTKLPLLLLESLSNQEDCIAADIPHATGLLVEHLYNQGHRSICLISAYQRKIDGFLKAVKSLPANTVEAH